MKMRTVLHNPSAVFLLLLRKPKRQEAYRIDIGADSGTDILAAAGGTVTFSGQMSGYGNYIIIDHGNGIETAYGHCSKLLAEKGENVRRGDKIALVGSTGNSTGPHLHFEIKINGEFVDPLNYVFY